jgi:hypothetical protein
MVRWPIFYIWKTSHLTLVKIYVVIIIIKLQIFQLSKVLVEHFLNITKNMIGLKIHVKIWIFEYEMNYNFFLNNKNNSTNPSPIQFNDISSIFHKYSSCRNNATPLISLKGFVHMSYSVPMQAETFWIPKYFQTPLQKRRKTFYYLGFSISETCCMVLDLVNDFIVVGKIEKEKMMIMLQKNYLLVLSWKSSFLNKIKFHDHSSHCTKT